MDNFLFALFITIAIEVVVAFSLGFKKEREIAMVILVNIITNPALNYFFLVNRYFNFLNDNLALTMTMEFLVVLIEWGILVYVLGGDYKKLFQLSFLMNFCSYMFGVLLFG